MHPLTFGMKRMFLRSVAINRRFTKHHHLTPARFDMLVAIRHGRVGAIQRNVRYQLGVQSPTVSRMMASLEKLGYIQRCKYPPDRRHRWVTLTEVGRHVIDAAQGELTYGPFGENVARALVSRRPDQREPTEKAIAAARTLFRTIRGLSGDSALLRYPPYLPSGERMAEHDIPYPGEHPAWLAPPPTPDPTSKPAQ
jgi:DNA-binding MarR family transcriptional regulator